MTTTPANMDREAWEQVDRLYHAALERPAAERSSFLNEACPDPDLRSEVESLLNFELADGSVFDSPAWEKRLAPGERLGPYEIVGRAGAGGMGEVWKARDTRLGRDVAIKVCAERFSDRFRREARAIAALNHPHICTLYDVGIDCLVMEYIEGAPIHGPLPLDRALKLGAQIAGALHAAHRKGIVHRDLKPANILLTKSGVKVLDFGLAKMQTPVAAGAETETATQRGVIIGTLNYMSPEQVQGKEMDGRSDIFSFGLVLYEMLTGRRAFEAENSASVIAAILEREPPHLEEIEPAGLRLVLHRCLTKDPDDRWQSATDLKAALEFTAEAAPQQRPRRRFGAGWLAAALFAAMFVATLVVYLRGKPQEQRVVRLQIPAPGNDWFTWYDKPALSPDGTRIVFSANEKLIERSLDSLATQELPGTEGGHLPFWSPDGRSVAFFAGGVKLKRTSLSGGSPVALCDVAGAEGGAWNREGVIVFAPTLRSSLMRIGADGGTPVAVTRLDPAKGETGHAWPSFLPDGRHFLFTAYASKPGNGGVFIGSLDSGQVKRLLPEETNAQYTEPGYVMFSRGGKLMAQPFDAGRLRITGDPFPVAQEVSDVFIWYLAGTTFSASGGVLAYRTGSPEAHRLRWFDRKGSPLGYVGLAGQYWDPALSPDGHAVAVSIRTASASDIWVFDLVRGTNSRLTFGGGNHFNPSWSPDGRQIAFRFVDASRSVIHRVLANGAGKEELAVQLDRDAQVWQWTGDGRYLIMDAYGFGKPREVWAAPLNGGGKPFPVVTGPFDNSAGRVSPDGKWIAYDGSETGRAEVYVQDFPPKGGKWPISTAGGTRAEWRADGRELFYRENSKMMSVDVKANAGKFEAGVPRLLFDVPRSHPDPMFDVSADGQRFLPVVSNEEPGALQPITVVLNWTAGIKR